MTTSTARPGLSMIVDNYVFLRGELPAQPQSRTLANGTDVTTFQLAVKRAESASARNDVLDCSCRASALRRQLARFAEGDRIEVTGRLQRRFWRAAGGIVSRYEVDVETIRRAKKL